MYTSLDELTKENSCISIIEYMIFWGAKERGWGAKRSTLISKVNQERILLGIEYL